MRQNGIDISTSLSGLTKAEWLASIAQISMDLGHFVELGPRHFASFLQSSETLLVTFETLQGIEVLSPDRHPLGWQLARQEGWSHLCIMSDGDTWFRDPMVYRYFDKLSDDGVFDAFEKVIFYGAGPCGYAAASYCAAAPGASVLVVQPQATLDPRITEWDDRFADLRRMDFTSRYGFAPDMADAASDMHVLYDPAEPLDAMHAALFTKPHVHKQRLRFMGDAIQTDLLEMDIFKPMLVALGEGALDTVLWAKLLRKRRGHPPYLRNLTQALMASDRVGLVERLQVYFDRVAHQQNPRD